ncbi:TIGR03915 family putative DNA repair protein [Clostridium sp. UBA5119]|uniref:TIGR03915 family putative DNA repair protein n=1 Tax=Clostridium sp. UBA5119 TaxID=1946366 RepID=UPI003216A7A5
MKEFLYDGSFEGLLTTIFYAYSYKEDVKITISSSYVPSLITTTEEITTEEDKFNRVYSSIKDNLSYLTLKNVYYLYLSALPSSEDLIFKYIKLCYKFGDSINLAKNNDIILTVDKYCRRVSLEAHRFTGFVRFKEIAPFTFYSVIEPDHNILPLIQTHFIERFSDQNFIIHDIKRELALIYNKKDGIISSFSKANGEYLEASSLNDNFESLWKEFYNSINIKERENLKLTRRSMPIRYWNHLPELK